MIAEVDVVPGNAHDSVDAPAVIKEAAKNLVVLQNWIIFSPELWYPSYKESLFLSFMIH